jgi:hypothetical protein
MLVSITLPAALVHRDTRRLARFGALLVGHALHTLVRSATGASTRLLAIGVGDTFGAQPRRGIAERRLTLAVAVPAAGQAATPPGQIAARARLAVAVDQAVDAAPIPRVAHLPRALGVVEALDASPAGSITGRPVRRAMAVVQALDAKASAITRRLSRLAAVGVVEALNAHVELVRTMAQRLPRTIARVSAGQRTGREHVVAALVWSTVVRRAALDAHVAFAGGLGGPAVPIDQALSTGAISTVAALPRAVARLTALERRAHEPGKQIERAAFIQVTAGRDGARCDHCDADAEHDSQRPDE